MAVILIPTINTLYSSLNTAIFQSLAFLAFASHLKTMFTDPVSKNYILKYVLIKLETIFDNIRYVTMFMQYKIFKCIAN